MPDEPKRLRWRAAILGPPLATIITPVLFVVLGAANGNVPDLWSRPFSLALGSPLALLCWHVVVRPRHRWWAVGAALIVTSVAYQLLFHQILVELPFPWAGVVSFAVAGWLGAIAYVAVTRRAAMPRPFGTAVRHPELAPGQAYQVRFGLTRRDLLMLPSSAVVVAVSVALLPDEPAAAAVGITIGGGFLLLRFVTAMSRRVALRIDLDGVTLGATPPWSASRTAVVPWSDIEAVVLWTQHAGATTMNYIGLQRRPGLPSLPGSARRPGLRRINQAVARHIPPGVVADSRPIAFWQLHLPTLQAAVHQFAPTVKIIDLD